MGVIVCPLLQKGVGIAVAIVDDGYPPGVLFIGKAQAFIQGMKRQGGISPVEIEEHRLLLFPAGEGNLPDGDPWIL